MDNATFWSVTGEVAGIGPSLNFDGVEQPNRIEVRIKTSFGKFFTRTLGLPTSVPVLMGKKLTLSGIIEMFRSRRPTRITSA